MAKTYSLTIPHTLGRAAARTRLQEALSYAQAQVGAYASDSRYTWEGDDLVFSVTAMGQTASGRASVGDDAIAIGVQLPLMLAAFLPMIRGYVEGTGRQFFADAAPKTAR